MFLRNILLGLLRVRVILIMGTCMCFVISVHGKNLAFSFSLSVRMRVWIVPCEYRADVLAKSCKRSDMLSGSECLRACTDGAHIFGIGRRDNFVSGRLRVRIRRRMWL